MGADIQHSWPLPLCGRRKGTTKAPDRKEQRRAAGVGVEERGGAWFQGLARIQFGIWAWLFTCSIQAMMGSVLPPLRLWAPDAIWSVDLVRESGLPQGVGNCGRCRTLIELLSRQWRSIARPPPRVLFWSARRPHKWVIIREKATGIGGNIAY